MNLESIIQEGSKRKLIGYHNTPLFNLIPILRKGLEPGHGISEESDNGVYFHATHKVLPRSEMDFLGDMRDIDNNNAFMVCIQADLSSIPKDRIMEDPMALEAIVVLGTVPSKLFTKLYLPDVPEARKLYRKLNTTIPIEFVKL